MMQLRELRIGTLSYTVNKVIIEFIAFVVRLQIEHLVYLHPFQCNNFVFVIIELYCNLAAPLILIESNKCCQGDYC